MINDLQVPVAITAGIVGVVVAVLLTIAIIKAAAATGRTSTTRGSWRATSGSRSCGRSRRRCSSPDRRLHGRHPAPPRRQRRCRRARRHGDLGLRPAVVVAFEYDFDADGEPEIDGQRARAACRRPRHGQHRVTDVIHSFWIPALNGTRDAVPAARTAWCWSPTSPASSSAVQGVLRPLARRHTARHHPVDAGVPDVARPAAGRGADAAEGDPGFEGQQSFLARCTSCHQINGLENAEGEPIEVEGPCGRCPGTPPTSRTS